MRSLLESWKAFAIGFVSGLHRSAMDVNLSGRLISGVLIAALLMSLIFVDRWQNVSAGSPGPPVATAAPLAAPPQDFVHSSSNTVSINTLAAFSSINTTAITAFSVISGTVTAPILPDGFELAKPVSPLYANIYSSVSSIGSVLGSFFGFSSNTNVMTTETASGNVAFDFDYDGKSDFARWQPSTGEWKIKNSNNGSFSTQTLGSSSSVLAPGDFDGDLKTDAAVFNAGVWTIKPSGGTQYTVPWGSSGDIPVTGDYNGDGRSDYAIFRPSTATWWIQLSSDHSNTSTVFGASSDILVPEDYDGDGRTDIAIFRPSTGDWHIRNSSNGATITPHWGVATDIPVPADYDADGKTDLAVYRPSSGTWFIYYSNGGGSYLQQIWGNYGDQPVPADYDGDGKADLAIWRPKTGVWFTFKSCNYTNNCQSNPLFIYETLGMNGDVPVEAAYVKKIGGAVQDFEFAKKRLSPKNSTGGTDLYSRNFSWGTGLVGLPGRAGLDAGFGISYNSLVWLNDTDNNVMVFDPDQSNVTPGFRMGFPTIEPVYHDKDNGRFSYLMVTPSGGRVEFQQIGASDTYETVDSSYVQLKTQGANEPNYPVDNISIKIIGTDGTQMSYEWLSGAFRCNQIKDRNGNFITISHDQYGLLRTVTDTLGRVITVNYDNEFYPTSITQNWNSNNGAGSTTTHIWASFAYTTISINPNFSSSLGVFGPTNGTNIKALQKITSAEGSFTTFDYNNYGQVSKINNYAADWHLLNYVRTNLQTPSPNQTDCPRFTETASWVENFNNGAEVVVNNSITENQPIPEAGGTGTLITVSMASHPNSAVSKTFVGDSDWTEALPIVTEDWADNGNGVARQRWTQNVWTQDDTNLPYINNPRVIESKVGDNVSVRKSQTIYKTIPLTNTAEYGLVSQQLVFDSDQSTILKKVETDYNLSSTYVSRRIIGLPNETRGYGVENGLLKLVSKMTYNFDGGNFNDTSLEQNISSVIQHDNTNYSANFVVGRANLTSMTRWNVDFPSGLSEAVTSNVKYNIAGASVATVDPLGRTVKASYADSFNDTATNRNAFAYPTKVTDPANNYSEVKYRFDIGANVWAKSPAPAGNSNGKEKTRTFDSLGRLIKDKIENSGAYTRYEYPANGVQTRVYTTIIDTTGNGADAADEVLAESWSDGAGRVLKSKTEHPGSVGGFAGSLAEYDILGRVKRSSVPTEIDSNWNPAGDDEAGGFLWTSQEFDWKGRVTRTVNPDGTDTLASYEGCGCAGGEIVTINSEIVPTPELNYDARRTRKIYSDILGRNWKTVVMNWNGTTPYTTTVQTYNGRDQATEIKRFQGTETSGNFQTTTNDYDGHGRLKTRHNPIENSDTDTTWIYNQDHSIQQVIDPRGAITNFTYNDPRGLVTNIGYQVPNGSTIPATPAVSFGYDALGNRTQMTDGTGTTTYAYDQLSRITSETRQFNGLSNNFNIEYEYTLAGGLKQIKDPTDMSRSVGYAYNKAGVLTSITGGEFGGVSQYLQNRSVRAFGAVKREDYGNGFRLEQQYDTRQRVSLYNIINPNQSQNQGNVTKIEYEYTASSQLKRSNNVLVGNFSRNFKYDQVGRLKSAETDLVSEIGSASTQSMEYDVWNNMTFRSSGVWGTSYVANVSSLYSNNRNTVSTGWNSQTGVTPNEIWQYDAGGMPTVTGEQTHKYDAAGQKIESVDRPILPPGQINSRIELNIQQTYDSDGQVAKRFERETFTNAPQRTETVYYLRSTVLGGKLLAELNEAGQKQKEYVYGAEGEAILRRENNQVRWLHVAPSIGSKFEVDSAGITSEGKEYDPLGGEIELQPPPQGSPDWIYAGNYQQSGNALDLNGGCMRGGFPIDCSEAARVASFGDPRTMNDTCPSCGGGGGMWLSPEQVKLLEDEGIESGLDWLGETFRPIGEGGRRWNGFTFNSSISLSPKLQTQSRQTNTPYPLKDLIDAARKVIENAKGKCADLLGKDALTEFDRISKNIVYDEEGKKVGSAAATTIDEDIFLRPSSYVFNEDQRKFYSGLTKKAHKSLIATKASMEKADKVIRKNGITNFDYAVAAVIHEFLHATGVFPDDVRRTEYADGSITIDFKKSLENQKKVIETCFKEQKSK